MRTITTLSSLRASLTPLFVIAAAQVVLHLATNGRYGFHRDELQFLWDAHHLDWGFVPYPHYTFLFSAGGGGGGVTAGVVGL